MQLPAYGTIVETPDDKSRLAQMRDSQWYVGNTVPNAGAVVTIDCGNDKLTTDLHPPKKEPMGQRLALLARAKVYGESIEYLGPVYQSLKIDGKKAVISFTHIGAGLLAKDGDLKGFAIAGEDKKFVNAQAKIEGDMVVVHADGIDKPLAVRYAWADYPVCNLYNNDGLPATPFRTDDWPLIGPKW